MRQLVFVTTSLSYGGAAKILCCVANHFSNLGFKVHILNLRITQGNDEFSRNINPLISVNDVISKKNGFFCRLEQIQIIKEYCESIHADLLIGFTMYPNFMNRIVSILTGIPSIMSERGDPYRTFDKSIISKCLIAVINGSKGAVFQTEGAAKFYSKKLQNRGAIIPNPIFLNDNVPDRIANHKTVVSVGRLDNHQKRYDVMLSAFRIFVSKHSDYKLLIYGDGVDKQLIVDMISSFNLNQHVVLKGLSNNPMKDIVNEGIFLLTSDYEGIPNALLEAMAIGMPVVSTKCSPGGAELLIRDHYNGILAEVSNPESIANALDEFANDSLLAKQCGTHARNVLHEYSEEAIFKLWEDYLSRFM